MIIFLSLEHFTIFFLMELLIGYLKILPLEMGSQMGKSTYAMVGGCIKRITAYGEEGGQFLAVLVRTY